MGSGKAATEGNDTTAVTPQPVTGPLAVVTRGRNAKKAEPIHARFRLRVLAWFSLCGPLP